MSDRAAGGPVFFILGPAGAGKSTLSAELARVHGLHCIELDRDPRCRPDQREGLQQAWQDCWRQADAGPLVDLLRGRARGAGACGAVLSLECTDVPEAKHLHSMLAHGVTPVVLYGSGAECMASFMARGHARGPTVSERLWRSFNTRSYALFSGSLFAPYRMAAFEGGRRRPLADTVREAWRRAGMAGEENSVL